jgi:ABC-type multidrug transport system ATPase subunit
LVIDDRNVSRFHATLEIDDSGILLRDLNSCNGTRLNGRLVESASVANGSEIRVGAARIAISQRGVRTESAAARLVARGVQQHVDRDRCILAPTDLEILPGELIALIGEAGSGKSTLLKILAGVTRPSAGTITMDHEDLSVQLPSIGFVPQADILHRGLTAREALRYGASLRLPPDTSASEFDETIDRVLFDLEMSEYGDVPIGTGLSGGQRRRVSVGMELLGNPQMLFLDEPGASLDVRLEGQLVNVLRRVTVRDCAVITITHRTTFLDRFDRLLVMGRGGLLRFDGRPRAALEHFDVGHFDGIYDRLAQLPPPEHRRAPVRMLGGARPCQELAAVRRTRTDSVHQLGVLARRTARVLSRDRRNLALLVAQAPLFAAGAALLFGHDAFALTKGNADNSAQLLFMLALIATWAGAITGARALIAERSVFLRERALGVAGGPYLTSKLLTLGAIGLIQSSLTMLVALTLAPLHSDFVALLVVFLLLALGTQVGLAMGLLLSAMAQTEEQAASLPLLLLVPQVLFGGAIVAVKNMGVLQPISALASTRWTLAGAGSALGLSTRPSADNGFLHYYGGFFDTPWGLSALILCVSFGIVVALTIWRLNVAWRR